MHNLGVAVVALLGFQIGLLVVNAIAFLMRARLLARIEAGHLVTREQASARDAFVAATSGLWLLVFVATVVVWLIWQHHAQSNSRRTRRTPERARRSVVYRLPSTVCG